MNSITEKYHKHIIEYKSTYLAAMGLSIYRQIQEDSVVKDFLHLLHLLSDKNPPAEKVSETYHCVFAHLARWAELSPYPNDGDAWRAYLLEKIIADDNIFTLKAGLTSPSNMGRSLLEAVSSDLRRLQLLYRIDSQTLCLIAQEAAEGDSSIGNSSIESNSMARIGKWPCWSGFKYYSKDNIGENSFVAQLRNNLASSPDWGQEIDLLASFHSQHGSGIFTQYHAFRWTRSHGQGRLLGIKHPDPIRLGDLIGYHEERAEVLENTKKFLCGLPAHNLLLYGDRGTGKSSTVKALLHEFGDHGLRMVEVPKSCLTDFNIIIQTLQERPQRFILFVDDLSFEEHEVEYKELKAILEGGLAARPENVLIYATSNRRHLVREFFSDRQVAVNSENELHAMDTVQEKLSLADRFGVTILFPSPDQALYLKIVEGLAQQQGLDLNKKELQNRALQWERWHNGRSARTARQFIDHLTGELALSNNSNFTG